MTNSNRAYIDKVLGCGVQEEVNTLLDDVWVGGRKLPRDTIQILSVKTAPKYRDVDHTIHN